MQFTEYERKYAEKGLLLAGADEAGRGPLAGPVVAGAVILPAEDWILGVDDSKKLSEKRREQLYEEIVSRAISWSVGIVDVEEIERVNILNAARHAFQIAVSKLSPQPDFVAADQIPGLVLPMPHEPIIKGDQKVYSIAAASIIAKVTRDRIMREYDAVYPEYGFSKHKGYATKAHREAILTYGPSPVHRMSFLKKLLGEGE